MVSEPARGGCIPAADNSATGLLHPPAARRSPRHVAASVPPNVRVRQWVVSEPHRPRYRLAYGGGRERPFPFVVLARRCVMAGAYVDAVAPTLLPELTGALAPLFAVAAVVAIAGLSALIILVARSNLALPVRRMIVQANQEGPHARGTPAPVSHDDGAALRPAH